VTLNANVFVIGNGGFGGLGGANSALGQALRGPNGVSTNVFFQ
jgi:hypothetical protein